LALANFNWSFGNQNSTTLLINPIPPATRAGDLLEQITKINQMVDLHEGNPFMQDQHRRRKQEWIDELTIVLREMNLMEGNLIAA